MVGWTIWQRVGWEGWEAGFYMDALSYGVSVLTLVTIALISRAAARRNGAHHPIAESAAVVRRSAHIAGDMRETLLIKAHHGPDSSS
jgi:hypothetical protein